MALCRKRALPDLIKYTHCTPRSFAIESGLCLKQNLKKLKQHTAIDLGANNTPRPSVVSAIEPATAANKIYTLRRGSLSCHRVLGPTRQGCPSPGQAGAWFCRARAGASGRFWLPVKTRQAKTSRKIHAVRKICKTFGRSLLTSCQHAHASRTGRRASR